MGRAAQKTVMNTFHFALILVVASLPVLAQDAGPVPASVVVREMLTKKPGDVYRELNAELRSTISKRTRSAIIDLDLRCMGDVKLVASVAAGYRSVGWMVEKRYVYGDIRYVFEIGEAGR